VKQIFLIAWKDLRLAFRDRAALLFILAAPFLLTLALGFITGHFSGSGSSGLSDIPVVLVNQDGDRLGNALVDAFQSDDLAGLLEPTLVTDPAQARQMVDDNRITAAVIIPKGFTASVIPSLTQAVAPGSEAVLQIEFYRNPTLGTSSGVIKTVLEMFLNRVEIARAGGVVAVTQLLSHGLIQPQDAAAVGARLGAQQSSAAQQDEASIRLDTVTAGGNVAESDTLAYIAPGMALMFLMYTVSHGGRTLLTERAHGTLPRLMISPVNTLQILAGKLFGVYLTGVAQMLILIGGCALFFNLRWGDPLSVLVLTLAAVSAATGWGALVTAVARTPGQVSSIGSALMLTFGILGGSFVTLDQMPAWIQAVSKITPNAWGLDGFTTLAMGGSLADLGTPLLALLSLGLVLFLISALIFRRRNLLQK
jgi:ABC-2 type transport system permease protein